MNVTIAVKSQFGGDVERAVSVRLRLMSERMSDEQISFKVTDRRLFNPDGTPRELPEEEKTESSAASTQTAASSLLSDPSSDSSRAGQAENAQEEQDEPLPDADDPASFVNFLMSIASNAASALGMMEHPVTHQREVDLELGKHWIDVLGMLERKTKGNLHKQEREVLEGLLRDLRMQYVSLTTSTSAKAARPYTGRDIVGG